MFAGAKFFFEVFHAVPAWLEFREFRGRSDSGIHVTDLVNQSVFECFVAGPHLALRDRVYIMLIDAAMHRDFADEVVISFVDNQLKHRPGFIGHFAVGTQFTRPEGRTHTICRNADRIQRALKGREHTEYADRPGDGVFRCKNAVSRHRYPVATGCRNAAH